jgi:uncharacterized protein YuzE
MATLSRPSAGHIAGHYDPDVDIAWIRFEGYNGATAVSSEHSWGLEERDPESGKVVAVEIWRASETLPAGFLSLLPEPGAGEIEPRDREATVAVRRPERKPFSWLQSRLCPELEEAQRAQVARLSSVMSEATDAHDPDLNREGVAALVSIAEDAIDDERSRGRELDTKMASLVGFTGLILSINVTLVGTLLDQKLGPVGNIFMWVGFLVAVIALLIALMLGVVGVLSPQKYRGLGHGQVRDFTSAATQAMTAVNVHQSMLGALADILEQDRPVNNCKAKLTKRVARWIAIGFLGVAAEAVTIGVRKLGL